MLTQKTRESILNLQKLYPEKRSALLPALHLAQAEIGYLPPDVQQEIAILFEITLNEVRTVVTFYDMFFEKPVGKHLIRICKNISCMLRGADETLHHFCSQLKVQPGETTEDGEFTIIASECLAACDRAPMVLLDETVVGPVHKADIDELLMKTKNGLFKICSQDGHDA